jgi:hypothetical protein
MSQRRSRFLAAAFLLVPALTVRAADTCLVKATFGGKAVTLKHCAVAVYDEKGATLFFNENPISAEEAAAFQMNSYPKDRDASNKKRTMMTVGFCPGGATGVPSPGAAKSVEISFGSPDPMLSRQWLFDPAADKDLKIQKLSGNLKPGGRLAGKLTGAKKSDDEANKQIDTWDIVFDVAIPAKTAAAGPGCS